MFGEEEELNGEEKVRLLEEKRQEGESGEWLEFELELELLRSEKK